MTVNVTSNLTFFNNCGTVADWAAHNIVGLVGNIDSIDSGEEEVVPKQGTKCLAFDLDAETGGVVDDTTITTFEDWSDRQIYGWANSVTAGNLASLVPTGGGQSGIYFIITDTSGNSGYWHVAGADTYRGGWTCFTADLSASPDTSSGTKPVTGSVAQVGMGFRGVAKSKSAHNMFIDYIRTGNKGITVTTTNASIATWGRVAQLDDANSIGIIREAGGAFYIQGPIRFGSPVASTLEFKDTNQVIFYEDASASKDQYALTVSASSNATTMFQFGDLSGSVGISGNYIRALGTPNFKMIATNPNINEFRLYGSTFLNASTFYLPDQNNASREVISCQFSGGGKINASRCWMQFCSIIQPNYVGVEVESEEMQVKDTTFINASFGIRINTATDYTLDNVTFSGCTYDMWNRSAGNASVFNTNGADGATASNPAGADTDYVSAVFLTVDVETAAAGAIQDARVEIETLVGTSLMNASTDGAGRAQVTYNYTGNKDVNIKVRKSSVSPKYFPVRTSGGINDQGFALTVVMTADTIAE